MPGLDGLATLGAHSRDPEPPAGDFCHGRAGQPACGQCARSPRAFDYVVKDAQGEFIPLLKAACEGAVGAMRMRRAKEAAEAEVRKARDRFEALAAEREILLKEVNHRVGNLLQLIAAMLHMQGSASPSADVKKALVDTTSRVMAVAHVHRRLYTSDDVSSVAVDRYLEAPLGDLRHSSSGPAPAHLSIEADPVEIDPDSAVAIASPACPSRSRPSRQRQPGAADPAPRGRLRQGRRRRRVTERHTIRGTDVMSLVALHRGVPGAAHADQDGVLRVEVDERPDVAPPPELTRELEREYRAVVEEILELRGDDGRISAFVRSITEPGALADTAGYSPDLNSPRSSSCSRRSTSSSG